MAKMFESKTDENGVRLSTNAHDESDYEHPESRWLWPAKDSVSGAVKRQVYGQIGSRVGTMTFNSLLDGEKR